jgi:thiamine transporter ThiT
MHRSFNMRDIGRFLLIIGAVVFLIGFIFWGGFAPKWLGRLPGDIRIERGDSVFYFPIVTCIVISILLSLIMSIFRR